jgi:hypothetical protein
MINFVLGIIVGLLMAIIAIIIGKKEVKAINDPVYTVAPIKNSFIVPKAQIIKTKDPVQEFLNDN